MNNRDSLNSFNKRPLPIESSCYDYNHQSFRQNAPIRQNSQQNLNFQSSNFSSSSLYNQFIADYPLNGSLKNENEFNSRSKPSSNTPRSNLTFFGEEPHFYVPIEQQERIINDEDQHKQTSENNNEASYDSIAFQAQQLLDRINNFQDPIECPISQVPDTYNNRSENNYATRQSSPPIKLQPILHNANFLKNRSSNQKIQNQNQIQFKQPIAPIRSLNQYQHNNLGNSYNFPEQINQNHNIPQKLILNQNNENDKNQFQKPPQPTFITPDFLSNNFEPTTKRLNTASEMVYPDNHVELLQHSYES